jgi:hypothetical protein
MIDLDHFDELPCSLWSKVICSGRVQLSRLKENLEAVHALNAKDTQTIFKIKGPRFETRHPLSYYRFFNGRS